MSSYPCQYPCNHLFAETTNIAPFPPKLSSGVRLRTFQSCHVLSKLRNIRSLRGRNPLFPRRSAMSCITEHRFHPTCDYSGVVVRQCAGVTLESVVVEFGRRLGRRGLGLDPSGAPHFTASEISADRITAPISPPRNSPPAKFTDFALHRRQITPER